jgi:hypothetical protein
VVIGLGLGDHENKGIGGTWQHVDDGGGGINDFRVEPGVLGSDNVRRFRTSLANLDLKWQKSLQDAGQGVYEHGAHYLIDQLEGEGIEDITIRERWLIGLHNLMLRANSTRGALVSDPRKNTRNALLNYRQYEDVVEHLRAVDTDGDIVGSLVKWDVRNEIPGPTDPNAGIGSLQRAVVASWDQLTGEEKLLDFPPLKMSR